MRTVGSEHNECGVCGENMLYIEFHHDDKVRFSQCRACGCSETKSWFQSKNPFKCNLQNVPLLPLRFDCSIRPGMSVHLDVGRERSLQAVEQSLKGDGYIYCAAQKDGNLEMSVEGDIHQVGTLAKIKHFVQFPEFVRLWVEGINYGIIETYTEEKNFVMVEVQLFEEQTHKTDGYGVICQMTKQNKTFSLLSHPMSEKIEMDFYSFIQSPGANRMDSYLTSFDPKTKKLEYIYGIPEVEMYYEN